MKILSFLKVLPMMYLCQFDFNQAIGAAEAFS